MSGSILTNNNFRFSASVIIFILVLFGPFTIPLQAFDDTTIYIDPSTQTIAPGESLTIDIYCAPTQPIKSFEMKITFDPSHIQANTISEGNIFDGFTTFFNNGTIDNTGGTIEDIYGLIVGSGTVSSLGTFITITFTALSTPGTSAIGLSNVGVTNDTGYIPIAVANGNVKISTPNPPPNNGGGGGYTPPSNNEQPPVTELNNPPHTPNQPSGPTFIERGVTYTYTSSSFDPDRDQIRLRFNWGDGAISDWTTFVTSNTTMSSNHTWQDVSSYNITVIAQDENGSNSSWSTPLEITVSEVESKEEPPVIDINIPSNISANQTIQFNASNSFIINGEIISFYWEFGDGSTATGETPTHTYTNPGQYTVTLTITDNAGRTYSKIINVTASASAQKIEQERPGFFIPYLPFIIIGIVIIFIFVIIVKFKEKIAVFISNRSMEHQQKMVKKSIEKIKEITYRIEPTSPVKETSVKVKKTSITPPIVPSEFILQDDIEKKVDEIIFSKMREMHEEIDRMK